MATEFGKLAARRRIPFPPSRPFPRRGRRHDDVLADIERLIADDPWRVEGDFALAYAGPPHPIAAKAAKLAAGSIFVEWVEDMYPGAFRLEKEAVSMMASLLGAPDGVGFLTTGGTESNITAIRLARDIAGGRVTRPEFVLPTSGHFSFRLGAQLLGVRIRDLPVDEGTMRPHVEQLRRVVNRNTVGIACSAPEGAFGQLDPVEAFADFAAARGLYLHVDAAFGGFILPFLHDLGVDVPPWDFSLPGVSTISTDGHKLGLMPLTTGFFLVRDRELLGHIPTEVTMLHTITSTKPGGTAAAAWAVLQALGRDGYRRSVANALRTVGVLADGISAVSGLRMVMPPFITVLCFTSDTFDVEAIHRGLKARGFGSSYGPINGIPIVRLSISPYRTVAQARRFLAALRETVEELGAMSRDSAVGRVMTVRGPVAPASLGMTLPHEHLYINQWHIPERFDYPLLTEDGDILADELALFRAAGGTTIVDATTPDAGRDPARLAALAERTGVTVVMACGWYRAPYYRPEDRIERRSVRDLAAGLIREIREGEATTGIRPGLIGEIGAEKGWVSPIEERTHRAAGQAQAATGLPLLTHSVYGNVGLEQLELFELEGADPARVAIGHADTTLDLGYLLRILERGALVMFDSFMDMRGRQEDRALGLVRELVDRGHLDRILLSLDVCRTAHLTFGGGGGFGYLANVVVPRLRDAGLDDAALRALTIDNPQRWLTIGGGA